jgi:hypothetical protein
LKLVSKSIRKYGMAWRNFWHHLCVPRYEDSRRDRIDAREMSLKLVGLSPLTPVNEMCPMQAL